jgi:GNAT superfamily N-acetyltransferase
VREGIAISESGAASPIRLIAVRPVAAGDVEVICRHRNEMCRAAHFDETALAAMAQPFREWLIARLSTGEYFGFFAEADGAIVGGVGLMILDWPPHPLHPEDGRRGYVCNVYVEPELRGRGIARALMREAEAEFERRGITYAVLHASPMGRPLYESTGWTGTNEMRKQLRSE